MIFTCQYDWPNHTWVILIGRTIQQLLWLAKPYKSYMYLDWPNHARVILISQTIQELFWLAKPYKSYFDIWHIYICIYLNCKLPKIIQHFSIQMLNFWVVLAKLYKSYYDWPNYTIVIMIGQLIQDLFSYLQYVHMHIFQTQTTLDNATF